VSEQGRTVPSGIGVYQPVNLFSSGYQDVQEHFGVSAGAED
jgi:hypothetical protein